jgi:hypothetical protein
VLWLLLYVLLLLLSLPSHPFFFSPLIVLEISESLELARQALYHLAIPQALFALVIFSTRIQAWAGLDPNRPIYTSYIAEMTGMYHHAHLFIG